MKTYVALSLVVAIFVAKLLRPEQVLPDGMLANEFGAILITTIIVFAAIIPLVRDNWRSKEAQSRRQSQQM